MYCGADIADDVETCPACGAPSHYQQRGESSQRRKKFIMYFVLLVVVCVFFILWLPR
jgi:predicted nucleic acid-binding Zn ribbon protein